MQGGIDHQWNESHSTRSSARLSRRLAVFARLIGIVVLPLAAYWPALKGTLLLDDDKLLTQNDLVQSPNGLSSIWGGVTAMLQHGAVQNAPLDYWPVTNSSFWLEWRLRGTHPRGYHATNLAIHIGTVLLLWAVLRKLAIPGAFLAALVFAVHPMNVESVAWISQRKNLLAMFFFLLAIWTWLEHDANLAAGERDRRALPWLWYSLSLAAFTLAMLSKGSAAVLPPVLIGLTWWRSGWINRWDVLRTAPFFLIAAALTAVNIWFQRHGTETVIRDAGMAERLAGASVAIWFYLSKILVPLELLFFYQQWQIDVGDVRWWLPLVAGVAATATLIWTRGTVWGRSLLAAWGFFGLALVPVLGFVDVGAMKHSLVANHYAHIAMIGVIALISATWSVWQQGQLGLARFASWGAMAAVCGVLWLLTTQRCELFADTIGLYETTLAKNPSCWLLQFNLANAYERQGQPEKAVDHYQQALHYNSQLAAAHDNMGNSLRKLGRIPEAIEQYRLALALKPDYSEAHNNLGIALSSIGRAQEGRAEFELALKIDPNNAQAHNNLAVSWSIEGNADEAIQHATAAIQIKPDSPEGYNNLAGALILAGRNTEAIEQCRHALQLKSDFPDAHFWLGTALASTDQPAEAVDHYREAIRLRPDYAHAYANLAASLAQLNHRDEAIRAARTALDFARKQGQTEQAQSVEKWLKDYLQRQSQPTAGRPDQRGNAAP